MSALAVSFGMAEHRSRPGCAFPAPGEQTMAIIRVDEDFSTRHGCSTPVMMLK